MTSAVSPASGWMRSTALRAHAQRLEQSALHEGHLVRHRDDVAATDGHVLGERAGQVGAVEGTVVADVDLALIAVGAGIVEQHGVGRHAHAHLEVGGGIGAHLGDDAGELMAEDGRELDVVRVGDSLVPAVQGVVGAADAARLDLHQDFVVLDLGDRRIFDVLPRAGLGLGHVNRVHLAFHWCPFRKESAEMKAGARPAAVGPGTRRWIATGWTSRRRG